MAACLDENTAVALIEGRLSKVDAEVVHDHTADCSICRRLIAALAEPAEPLQSLDSPFAPTEPRGEATDELAPGARIARYEVIEKIGSGGMGTVYAARDPELDRNVAIKVLHSGTDASADRLVREARAMAKLRHPNVVAVYEVGRYEVGGEDADVFIVMELIDGVTLRTWLGEERDSADKLRVLRGAGAGLAAAHAQGLVHRDFKPDNVMVGVDGRAQVLDFGLAKAASALDAPQSEILEGPIDITRSGALIGTPAYMSPEQLTAGVADARSDQFAFCVVAFEVMHGVRPFGGESISELADNVASGTIEPSLRSGEVSSRISEAIERGLAVERDDRHAGMRPLLAALRRRRDEKRRWLFPAATATVLLGVAGAISVASQRGGDPEANATELILSQSELPTEIAQPVAGDPLGVTVHRLSNGLTVYISPNRKKPRIAWRLIVRAGSRDNPPGLGGLAHMVEHVSFKGTEKLGTTDYAKESVHLSRLRELYAQHAESESDQERAALLKQIDEETTKASAYALPREFRSTAGRLGVEGLNGFTDRDLTWYVADIPSQKFALWAKLEGERWTAPVFRLFHSEVLSIYNEKRVTGAASGWQRALGDAIFAGLFPGHAYDTSPIGSYEEILAEPFTALESFFASWYVPNNAALVLTGDIDPETAIPVLEKEFAAWRPKPLPTRLSAAAPPLAKSTSLSLTSDGPRVAVVGWRFPAEDNELALVVGDLLKERAERMRTEGNATLGWLHSSSVLNMDGSGVVFVLRATESQDHSAVIKAFDDSVAAIADGDFAEATLEAVVRKRRAELALGLEGNELRLQLLSDSYRLGREWPDSVRTIKGDSIFKADVVAFVKRHFGPARMVIRVEPGESEQQSHPEPPVVGELNVPVEKQSAFAAQLLATESVDQPMRYVWRGRDFETRETNLGPLVAVRNNENDLFELTMRWHADHREEPILCHALWALANAGTANRSAADRKKEWHQRATTASVECKEEGVRVVMRGIDRHFAESFSELTAWLSGEGLTTENWSASLRSLQSLEKEWSSVERSAAEYGLRGNDSWYLVRTTASQLSGVSVEQARAVLSSLSGASARLTYFGPRDIDELGLGGFAARGANPPNKPRPYPRTATPRVVAVDLKDASSVRTAVTVVLGPLSEEQIVSAQVFASYIEGELELARDRHQEVSYAAQSHLTIPTSPEQDARLTVFFVAEPKHVVDGLGFVLNVLKRTPNAAQVERASQRTLEVYRREWLSPRELAETVTDWIARGQSADPRPARVTRLSRIGTDDLDTFAKSVQSASRSIALTGGLADLDTNELKQFGELQTMTPKELAGR